MREAISVRLLGEYHMYHGEGVAFEPEGLLSTLPGIVNVVAGCLFAAYGANRIHLWNTE